MLASVGVLALPVTIFLAGPSVFSIDDRFLWTLHEDYITECDNCAGSGKVEEEDTE